MDSSASKEDLEQAYSIGYSVEGPRALLAAIIDVLAKGQPDELVFRNAIYQRVAPNVFPAPEGTDPYFARQVLNGAMAAAAEMLHLGVEVVWEAPVETNDR